MSKMQFAMVMDLNKCLGCQTCTVACKKQWTDHPGMESMYWNNVETRPGAGYPRDWEKKGGGFTRGEIHPGEIPPHEDYGHAWDYNYEATLFNGTKSVVMPDAPPRWGMNWDEDQGSSNENDPYFFYLPRICNHCTHPACLEACTRKAIYKRPEDGIVLLDQERCRGYRDCVRACPYKKIYYNEVLGKSQKCIFCYPRLAEGRPNACAAQCPGRLRFAGLLGDTASPVHKLVKVYEVALPLHPEKGTGPNVYYVPPFGPPRAGHGGENLTKNPRIPVKVLISLFGEKVLAVIEHLEAELHKAQNGEKSEALSLLIGRDENVRYKLKVPLKKTSDVEGKTSEAPPQTDEPVV